MQNWRKENIGGTIKHRIECLVNSCANEWHRAGEIAVFGYSCHQRSIWLSTFEMLYGVKPKCILSYVNSSARSNDHDNRQTELLALFGQRANKMDKKRRRVSQLEAKDKKLQIGGTVLVVRAGVFDASKWLAFKSTFYRSCVVTKTTHFHYMVWFTAGGHSWVPIHARRLLHYYSCW